MIKASQSSSSSVSATQSPSSSSSSSSSASQACAACKYQRRKCAADCPLAPYFPHERHRQFLNAHRLFGVSNITKIIRSLDDPAAREHAMRSIIFQSDARASDPVGGCFRIIRDLQLQLDLATAHLQSLNHHLGILRAAASANSASNGSSSSSFLDNPDELLLSSWVLSDQIPPSNGGAEDVVLKEESFREDGSGNDSGFRDAANYFSLTDCST